MTDYATTKTAVACECCLRPLAPGTPAKIDREKTGVIICNDCFGAQNDR